MHGSETLVIIPWSINFLMYTSTWVWGICLVVDALYVIIFVSRSFIFVGSYRILLCGMSSQIILNLFVSVALIASALLWILFTSSRLLGSGNVSGTMENEKREM